MPSKYATPEERQEARRKYDRDRSALIRALLEEHRTAMLRAHPTTLPIVKRGVPEVRSTEARHVLIRTLVRFFYDEVKEELDACRLVRESEGK